MSMESYTSDLLGRAAAFLRKVAPGDAEAAMLAAELDERARELRPIESTDARAAERLAKAERAGHRCAKCSGTGRFFGGACSECNGAGKSFT